jgi:pimeloyl-ACP methyl ester carboxylesterase
VVAWSPIGRCDRWDEATKAEWRRRGHMEFPNQRTGQSMRMSTAVLDDYERNRERLDIEAAATRLGAPLLVIHGARDESVPLDEGRQLASLNDESSLLIVGRAGHTYNAIHPLIHVPFELVVAAEASAHFVNANVGITLSI